MHGLVRYARSLYELLGNRRKFQRVPMSGTVFITCKGAVIDSTYVARCLDLSPRGIGIESSEPFALDQFVQVHTDDYGPRRLARVRYCIASGAAHRLGLEFIADPH